MCTERAGAACIRWSNGVSCFICAIKSSTRCRRSRAARWQAYAIATPARNPALPDVPTTKGTELPEYQVSAWNALFAPKDTPKPIIDKLNAALGRALDGPKTRARLLELGSDLPEGGGRTSPRLSPNS